MTLEHVYEEFIQQVKDTISIQPIPPQYNPSEWRAKRFNCYAYALQACMNLTRYDIVPGFIAGYSDYIPTKECTLQYFKEDCEALGLEVVTSDLKEQVSANEYKIAVYLNEGRDFHFIRQDSDGKWSHKVGWKGDIEYLDQADLVKDQDGCKFIKIFKVSKK